MNALKLFFVCCFLGTIFLSWHFRGQFAEVESALNGESSSVTADIVETEPDEIPLPEESRTGWDVGVEQPAAVSRPVNLSSVLPDKFRIWGGVVAANSGTAILTYLDETERDNKVTVGLVCDVRSGRGLARWKLDEFVSPYAIHRDGHTSIFTRKDGVLSARETLFIGRKVDGTNVPEFEKWQPLVDSSASKQEFNPEFEIIWAEFAGRDHIATLNKNGKLHIWDVRNLERRGVVTGVKGTPALTPDGNKIAFLTDQRVSLLDPDSLEVVASNLVGELPEDAALAFQPGGRQLAISGKRRTLVFDTRELVARETMIESLSSSRGMELMSEIAWFGDYLYCHERLYSIDSPIPVWTFSAARWLKPMQGELWGVVKSKQDRDKFVFRSFDVPVARLAHELDEIYRNEDIIALQSGDPVSIDVSGLPVERRGEIYGVLASRIQENGFLPSQNAEVTLRAFLEQPRETEVTYSLMWSGKQKFVFSYRIEAARMEFVKGEDRLWHARKYILPPGSIAEDKMPRSEFVEQWGGPDYDLFNDYKLPRFLCARRGTRSLGSFRLWAEGLE
ncbi:MAG: hypothetical protein AAF456_07555 [Planctomycetota bacterium]